MLIRSNAYVVRCTLKYFRTFVLSYESTFVRCSCTRTTIFLLSDLHTTIDAIDLTRSIPPDRSHSPPARGQDRKPKNSRAFVPSRARTERARGRRRAPLSRRRARSAPRAGDSRHRARASPAPARTERLGGPRSFDPARARRRRRGRPPLPPRGERGRRRVSSARARARDAMGRSQYAEILDEAEAMERCARSHRSRASPRRRRRGRRATRVAPARAAASPPKPSLPRAVRVQSSVAPIRGSRRPHPAPTDPSPSPPSIAIAVASPQKPSRRGGVGPRRGGRAAVADAERAADGRKGAFYTLVPIRPRRRGERRSLRTFAVVSLRPPLAFNPRPRRLSTPTDAFELHPKGVGSAR